MGLLGAGLGPTLLGFTSDYFATPFVRDPGDFIQSCPGGRAPPGAQAALDAACRPRPRRDCRLALLCGTVFFLWAAVHFLLASRTLKRDLYVRRLPPDQIGRCRLICSMQSTDSCLAQARTVASPGLHAVEQPAHQPEIAGLRSGRQAPGKGFAEARLVGSEAAREQVDHGRIGQPRYQMHQAQQVAAIEGSRSLPGVTSALLELAALFRRWRD